MKSWNEITKSQSYLNFCKGFQLANECHMTYILYGDWSTEDGHAEMRFLGLLRVLFREALITVLRQNFSQCFDTISRYETSCNTRYRSWWTSYKVHMDVDKKSRYNHSINKHTESIAKTIQVPQRPQQIQIWKHYFGDFRTKGNNSWKSRSTSTKVELEL